MTPKVGVSLAVHNSRDQARECLAALARSTGVNLYPVVVDDGSSDGTRQMLRDEYPQVNVLHGDGNLWWTRATNWGIRASLTAGCDYVLLLNPDVLVEPGTVATLVGESQSHFDAIVTPLVLDRQEPARIWEAGHDWRPVWRLVPLIWTTRYQYPRGTLVSELPQSTYATVSVVGRGGLLPRAAFTVLGMFDEARLPQYGADADMTVRAWRHRYPMYVVPQARVLLNTRQTGMAVAQSWGGALRGYRNYLFSRKHGEAVRVLYYFTTNNLPFYQALPSFLFMLGSNTVRYWQRFLRARQP